MMSALPLAAARLSKLWILCLNDLLDGDLCKHFYSFHIFFFFWFSNTILSDALISPVSQRRIEQVMTSQIRSHIEYLIHTDNIIVLVVKIDDKYSLNGGFEYNLMMIRDSSLFLEPPCI